MAINSWNKFALLMWKNWLLVWRHKLQTIIEILVPVVFSALLVLIRSLVEPELFPNATHFNPVAIDTLDPLRNQIANSTQVLDWRLMYTPKNVVLEQLVAEAAQTLKLSGVVGVATDKELQHGIMNQGLLAGIKFSNFNPTTSDLPKNLKYSIRFPSELRTGRNNPLLFNWRTDLLFPRFQTAGPRNNEGDDGGLPPGYRQEGFLAIQNALATAYLRIKSGGASAMPEILLQRYPYPKYTKDILLTGLENLVSLIIMLSFVYPCINLVKFIAAEKEKQLKEAMKIMGLPNWLHWTGWFIRSMIFMMSSISLIVVLLKVRWYPESSVSVFTYTDWSVLWFFLFIYSIATTMYCFMLSVFFSKANTAAAVAGLVWFVFYAAYTFTRQTYDTMGLWQKLLLSLLSNTGMAFAFQTILRFEASGEGLQWSNLFRPVSIDDNLSVGLMVVMLLICSCLYLLITLYVEKIFPGEYGVPDPWYFPFTRTFWCGQGKYLGIEDSTQNSIELENQEEDPKGRNAGIQIRNLRKIYSNKKIAVHGLNLNMYDDQITVLLGHNGAGKTTTMSMLTGMFPPTTGSAIVNGRDIRTDINGVRNSLGLCPQHNILFDELTVREHIVFYSRLKGLEKDEIEAEVTKYIKLIDLEPKINALSSTLSGGMKRKLSVVVAFCGGSKVVLCDEPTSGMDPAARRALWDVLQMEKKGRTVLLSTHFMDEADILGDRIAIMANGELKCCGSSYFLKKKFGVGYHLICVKKPSCDSMAITDLLKKYIPDIVIENDIGTELSYQLPDNSAELFKGMFEELEQREHELGVESYGVSLTTLEEVFMKVGTDPNKLDDNMEVSEFYTNKQQNGDAALKVMEMEDVSAPAANGNGALHHEIGDNDSFGSQLTLNFGEDVPLLRGLSLARNQIKALFKKKVLQTVRNWVVIMLQIIIPVSFIVITVFSERARAWFLDLPSLDISLTRYLDSVTVLEKNANADPTSLVARITAEYENQYKNVRSGISLTVIYENIQSYILRLSETILVRINSQYLVGATILNSKQMTVWFNNQPYHAAPLTVSVMHNAIIRAHLGKDHDIHVFNEPFPYTSDTRIEMMQVGGSMGFQLAVNVGFAMAFVAAFYVLVYIREQKTRSKLLQFVSGANVLTFWLTAFIWDFFTFLVTILFLIGTFAIFQEDGWKTPTELGRIFIILTTFAFAALPVTFISSKFFTVPASGFTRMTMFYIFTGMACFFIVFIMSIDIYDLEHVADGLTWAFLLFPHFALSHSLNNLNIMTTFDQICQTRCDQFPLCNQDILCQFFPDCCRDSYFQWDSPGIGRNVIYMLSVGLMTFLILLLIEYRIVAAIIYRIKKLYQKYEPSPAQNELIDSDVLAEKERVNAMTKMEIESHNLVLKNMTKLYGKFRAVDEMSVGVDHSECFGLLGVNGAGKTSTFKMLTGDVKISYGEAWVRGISLKDQMNKVHQIIGYCPQFDALIDELTGRETLEMFCLLRGVPDNRIRPTSIGLAVDLNFIKHIDKKVREYSGGNKRKLSTAVALIGNPAVVYLDEPTTGMDPGAKRQLWNMVCKVRKSGKSIVLTSHSMDECEALCTRLAIMVNGEFKCIGSVQHLKNKFSKGFTLTVKVKKPNLNAVANLNDLMDDDGLTEVNAGPSALEVTLNEIKQYVTNNFTGSFLKEEFQGLLTYYIPNTELKWSEMFGLMENAKQQFNIEDYSLSQTSLEQVFLAFAKQQREEKIDRNGG